MKKYSKLFIFTLLAFFISSVSVLAREMGIDELGEEASKIQPDAGYVYILGEYAFTSNYNIHQEDLIIAATSLKLENPTDLSQAVIYQIERKRDENYNPIGWKEGKNVLGTKKIPSKFNVKWIDMHHILEKSKATLSADIEDSKYSTYKNVLSDKLNFKTDTFYAKDAKVKIENNKVTGLLLKKSHTDLYFNDEDDEKYADEEYYFATIVEVPEANKNTIITITNLNGETKKATWNEFDVQSGTPGIVILLPIDKKDWEDSADKQITITVDVDGDIEKNEYAATEYKLDLSELKFQEKSEMNLTTKDLPTADVESISKDWGYTKSSADTYELKDVDGANKYKLTGTIVQQEINENVFSKDEKTGFYFLLSVGQNIDESLYNKATVTYPGNKGNKTSKITDSTGVTILFSTSDANKSKPITITVDLDGEDGDEYFPVDYEIDLKDLILEKSSKFSVESIDESGKTALDTAYGWTEPSKFNVKFDTTGTTVKVTGLLPILESFEEGKKPFEDDEATGYYLPFVIKTLDKTTNGSDKVTVQFIHKGEEGKTITSESFDGKDVLYILRHLDKKATDRTFEIIVDMDGDGEEYAPYTITFDWSELKLQEKTIAEVKVDGASATDKEQLKGYGYKSEVNSGVKISGTDGNYTLEGKLVEQVLNDNVFAEKTGYYFDFTFKLPEGVKPENVKISRLTDNNLNGSGNVKKTFKESEYDKEDNSLTILYQFTEDPKCKTNSGNCKLYYSVDYDGTGDEYLPTLVTIDYSKLTFEKSSLFTIEGLDSKDGSQFVDDGWLTKEGYYTKVELDPEKANTYKVSGVLPIFTDEEWEDNENPFESDHVLYYLGLLLKLTNAPENMGPDGSIDEDTINVKFFHDENDETESAIDIFDHDFYSNKELYILKALRAANDDGSPVAPEDKYFTITVDLDGKDKEEYAPYTVTIDYSELKFQDSSSGASFALLDTENLDDNSPEKKELEGYDFDSTTVDEVKDKLNAEQPDIEPYIEGIEGTIKEQTLKSGFTNNKGYFVPIKISVPKDEDWFADYKNTWKLILNTESKVKKTYEPTSEEYEQGWVMVLFRLDDSSDKKIKYEIDFDGDGDAFLPYEYTIDYSKLSFEEAHKLTFNGLKTGLTVYDGDTITEDMLPEDTPEVSDSYHNFAYWANEEGTNIVGTVITSDTEDNITLEPHWNLYSDKFIADVLEDLNKTEDSKSEDFSSEFKIEDYVENSGEITITVIDPTTKLSRMNDTSIPGAIAYILSKEEINEITLSVNGEEKTFTKNGIEDQAQLKKAIQDGAKELYSKILKENFDGKTDEDVTLSDLANKEGYESFTLKFNPEKVSKTVTLVKAPAQQGISLASNIEVPTDYKFTFESDMVVVKTQQELENALSSKAEHIFIGDNFKVDKTIDIERKVEIDGGSSSYTITAGSGVNTIFTVKSNAVTIKNIELKNSQNQAIIVENGSLTTAGVKITHSDSIPESFEAGIEVKDGASLTASNMTFDSEHYNKPLVKAEKENTKVDLKDKESKTALRVTKEKITKYSSKVVGSYGDVKEEDLDYKYYNYYNDSNNSKIYETIFHNYEGRQILKFVSYNYYNEKVSLPPESVFKAFYKLTYDGNVYELLGFTESRDKTVYDGNGDYSTLPEGIVQKDELKATDDKTYYSSYKVSLPKNVTKVTTATALKEALENQEITEIYIDTINEIDMTNVMPEINLSRSVSIIGKPEISKIKVGNIKISADNVFLSRLNLEFTQGSSNNALIDITGNAQDVSMWQCVINNSGDAVDYAIYYHGNNKSIVDIRWSTFNNSGNKFNKGYIYVANELATGSNISYNTFRQLSSEDLKKTAVIISKFSSENILQEDDNIKINSNTFNENDYAIKFEKDASGTKANISLANNSNINIAVEYSDENKDFGSILLDADLSKVKVTYIDKDGKTYEKAPQGVTGLTFINQIEMVPSNVPESATISGLTKNGNKYSGLVSQSDDGKFYLPLTLTSSKFDDRVSTVTVTDPNENSEKYLYSLKSNNGVAVISSANTMKLNLEAIKSSKINNEAGKVYNIAIDYNGDKKTDNTYTIDYSGVETLEEKVNAAAKNTLNSKSFTVKKDNHINGYTEEFTYKYNSELGLTHLTSTKDNVEEYTFSLKYVGKEDSKVSVVTRKQTKHEEGKVYINDWEYIHPIQVGRAIQEVTMLTDVMGETYINAIDKVKLAEGKEHTYIATLNRDKYNDWVKKNYLSNSKYSSAEWALNEIVEVEIKLDDNEQYIKSIKTSQKSSDNTFNVSFENVNSTEIKAPKEFLAENDKALTEQDIIDFYNKGIKWWEKHTGSTVYSE